MTAVQEGRLVTSVASPASRQVSWWSTYEWVQRITATVGPYPPAGTPAWCALDDDDPRKIAAVLDAGQHHVLRTETAQEELAQASHDVAAAADWPSTAREIHHRNTFHGTRPWMKRIAS